MICHVCCLVRDTEWFCNTCGETADRARSELVLATLLKNRSRAKGFSAGQRLGRLSRLLPGAGHLAAGRHLGGMFRLALLAGALFSILCGWAFDPTARWELPGLILAEETVHPFWIPLPAAAWPGLTSGVILGGCLLLIALYLLAVVDGSRLRHRFTRGHLEMGPGPERARLKVHPGPTSR